MKEGTLGEEKEHTITLLNGYSISVDYKNSGYALSRTRYTGECRCIKLYDDKKELVSTLVEENPHKGEDKTRVKEFLKNL